MENEKMKTECEALKLENQHLKEQLAALTEKIAEMGAQSVEKQISFKNQLKDQKSAMEIENERLKMMLELVNKEMRVLYESNFAPQLNYYKNECLRYENSTCWKITKPLRVIMDRLKKLFHR